MNTTTKRIGEPPARLTLALDTYSHCINQPAGWAVAEAEAELAEWGIELPEWAELAALAHLIESEELDATD